jgi:hypothetical protein
MIILYLAITFFFGVFTGFGVLWAVGRIPDGKLIIKEDEHGTKTFILDLDIDPYYIDQKKLIKFEVVLDESQ